MLGVRTHISTWSMTLIQADVVSMRRNALAQNAVPRVLLFVCGPPVDHHPVAHCVLSVCRRQTATTTGDIVVIQHGRLRDLEQYVRSAGAIREDTSYTTDSCEGLSAGICERNGRNNLRMLSRLSCVDSWRMFLIVEVRCFSIGMVN